MAQSVQSNASGPKCPKCGSTSVHGSNRGYSAGSGCCGGLMLGPLGLLCGQVGAGAVRVNCLNCGTSWETGGRAKSAGSSSGASLGSVLVLLVLVIGGIGVCSSLGGLDSGSGGSRSTSSAQASSPSRSQNQRPQARSSPPASRTPHSSTDCGTAPAPATVRGNWSSYQCRPRSRARDWSQCLPRTAYSSVEGRGCPGDERCCPP